MRSIGPRRESGPLILGTSSTSEEKLFMKISHTHEASVREFGNCDYSSVNPELVFVMMLILDSIMNQARISTL